MINNTRAHYCSNIAKTCNQLFSVPFRSKSLSFDKGCVDKVCSSEFFNEDILSKSNMAQMRRCEERLVER